jgi:hypothetical protein
MAKHITKTVIEDIAYQLKNCGLWIMRAKTNPEEIKELDLEMDLTDPEDVLDDLIGQLADTLADHDPGFDRSRFMEQASYKVDL